MNNEEWPKQSQEFFNKTNNIAIIRSNYSNFNNNSSCNITKQNSHCSNNENYNNNSSNGWRVRILIEYLSTLTTLQE